MTCIFILSAIFTVTAEAPVQLESGSRFYSPDRNTVVVYKPDQLDVRDARTNELQKSVTISLLFGLRWTGDSKTFVAIEHIAHGSDATFVHLSDGEWRSFVVTPPGEEYRDYAVIRVEAQQKDVRLSYSAATNEALYLISFTVDPSTQALANVTTQELSYKAWEALPIFGDKH
jgi:hypothetical protein